MRILLLFNQDKAEAKTILKTKKNEEKCHALSPVALAMFAVCVCVWCVHVCVVMKTLFFGANVVCVVLCCVVLLVYVCVYVHRLGGFVFRCTVTPRCWFFLSGGLPGDDCTTIPLFTSALSKHMLFLSLRFTPTLPRPEKARDIFRLFLSFDNDFY